MQKEVDTDGLTKVVDLREEKTRRKIEELKVGANLVHRLIV